MSPNFSNLTTKIYKNNKNENEKVAAFFSNKNFLCGKFFAISQKFSSLVFSYYFYFVVYFSFLNFILFFFNVPGDIPWAKEKSDGDVRQMVNGNGIKLEKYIKYFIIKYQIK